MDAPRMLEKMCREVLSDADVKAICKSRGFSAQEAASRAIFENFFLSDIGVAAAMKSLAAEEVALLYLLKRTGEEVDVAFFERIYATDRSRSNYYGTFNQRYQDVFKQLQASLIRKGVLLYALEADLLGDKTKLERWRFRFPREFEKFLPPLLCHTTTLPGPGEVREEVLRQKVQEAVEGKRASPPTEADTYTLGLARGDLRIGPRPFRVEYLLEWQRVCWEAAIVASKTPGAKAPPMPAGPKPFSPVAAATYAFAQLKPDEWAPPEALTVPLDVFCYGGKSAGGREVCEAGWQWGYLARCAAGGQTYYRLAASAETAWAEPAADPAAYLHAGGDGAVLVDLQTVPYAGLEQLAQMARFEVAGAHLAATPNLVKIGKATEELRGRPLVQWLRANAPAFRQAWETAEARWGQQIVHANLLIARVTDPGLRVQIERALPSLESLVVLSDEYVAFPRYLLGTVERVVTKSGHVIKTVQRDAKDNHPH